MQREGAVGASVRDGGEEGRLGAAGQKGYAVSLAVWLR